MDQNVRVSHRRTTTQVSDDSLRDAELHKPAHSSAMVIVLGLVALVSMAFGFVLGLLV
jgi:hypothetical protein